MGRRTRVGGGGRRTEGRANRSTPAGVNRCGAKPHQSQQQSAVGAEASDMERNALCARVVGIKKGEKDGRNDGTPASDCGNARLKQHDHMWGRRKNRFTKAA